MSYSPNSRNVICRRYILYLIRSSGGVATCQFTIEKLGIIIAIIRRDIGGSTEVSHDSWLMQHVRLIVAD